MGSVFYATCRPVWVYSKPWFIPSYQDMKVLWTCDGTECCFFKISNLTLVLGYDTLAKSMIWFASRVFRYETTIPIYVEVRPSQDTEGDVRTHGLFLISNFSHLYWISWVKLAFPWAQPYNYTFDLTIFSFAFFFVRIKFKHQINTQHTSDHQGSFSHRPLYLFYKRNKRLKFPERKKRNSHPNKASQIT